MDDVRTDTTAPPEIAAANEGDGTVADLDQESRDAQQEVEQQYEMRRKVPRGGGRPPKIPKPKIPKPGGKRRTLNG